MEAGLIDVLLVEDNPGDIYLIRGALELGTIEKRINVVTDGEQALTYLTRRGANRPDLILLDLNLPKIDGRQVLEVIKADPHLRYIPVIVLSSSNSESDVLSCYENHANCYLTKPADLDAFLNTVEQVESYWLSCVALPGL